MLNLVNFLEENARERPGQKAIISDEESLSYASLNTMANQVAHCLVNLGIRQGDKVALTCPNLPLFPVVYYGILKAGAVVTPLNVRFQVPEIAYHLKDSDAKVFICFEGAGQMPTGSVGYAAFQNVDSCEHFLLLTSNLEEPPRRKGSLVLNSLMAGQPSSFDTVQTSSGDTAVILYTSGTTGRPKGAELSHSNLVLNIIFGANLEDRTDKDTQLVVLPLFHAFAQTVQMSAAFYAGSAISLLPGFAPDAVLAAMQRDNITHFAAGPAMYWALLNYAGADDYDLEKISHHLRICYSGGAAIPVDVMRNFEKKFSVKILEGYGLSETSPTAAVNRMDRESRPGSVGFPIRGVQIRIVDEGDNDVPRGDMGEIIVRGHNVMKGYYKRPEATAAALRNGWFHTGDVGRMDDDGYLYIIDRVNDVITRGNLRVYPRQVEEVLLTHPAVSLAAVVGLPDAQNGEEIKAFVVLKPEVRLTTEKLVSWSRERMADHMYPRLIEFRDNLPMNATGKILKRDLRSKM
jgi:long-chain acyl-CoA synthetase